MDHPYPTSKEEKAYHEAHVEGRRLTPTRAFSFEPESPPQEYGHSPTFREEFNYDLPQPNQVPARSSYFHGGAPEVVYENPDHIHHRVDSTGLHYPSNPHVHHRSLSPPLSQGSTMVSADTPLAAMFAGEKEVYHSEAPVSVLPEYHEKHEPQSHTRHPKPPVRRRICGVPALCFVILAIVGVLAVVGAALGAGLGIGLKRHSKSQQPGGASPSFTGNVNTSIGGAINPAFYSKHGAWNGTGIAFAGVDKLVFIFFQHHSGDLRYMQLQSDGTWIGGGVSEVVANDAKNSTPISTVAYLLNGTQKYHVFYVDKNNYIKQRTYSNTTNIWKDGEVTAQKLQVYNADSIGLQACWYGNFYGDTDFTKFPTASGEKNTIRFGTDYGMHLWYPSDATTFQQYGYYEGQTNWTYQKTWPGFNPHGGVGCYSWGPGTVSYFMAVNLQNTVEVWFKDTNSSAQSTDKHPINSWANATEAAIPNVFPSTSLGYTTYFIAQAADRTMHGYNYTWAAENTTWHTNDQITVSDASGPVAGLGGSHMTVSAVASKSGGANLYVFYQTAGDDITLFVRDINGGPWGSGRLPIPDT